MIELTLSSDHSKVLINIKMIEAVYTGKYFTQVLCEGAEGPWSVMEPYEKVVEVLHEMVGVYRVQG